MNGYVLIRINSRLDWSPHQRTNKRVWFQ